jgi:phosphoglycolate phosphatase
MKYTHVLFDLDGTLTDPFQGIANSLKFALERFGIEEKDDAVFGQFIGPPLETTFRGHYGFGADDTQKAVGYYREYYAEKGVYENTLYEGIEDLLRTLNNENTRCVLATSKLKEFAVKVLQLFQLDPYFSFIAGSSPDGSLAEKEDIIRFIMRDLKPEKETTIMVGDRKYDIQGAHANGIQAVAAGYGYGSREELEQEAPEYFCADVRELCKVLLPS